MLRACTFSPCLLVAAALANGVCSAQTTTALALVSALARDHGYCVVSPLLGRELGEVTVAGHADDSTAIIGLLEQAGLSVYTAGDSPLAVVCDQRPGRKGASDATPLVLASEFLATLPASVIQSQREAVRSTTPPSLPHFPLADLSQNVHEAAGRWLAALGKPQALSSDVCGRIQWCTNRLLRVERDGHRSLTSPSMQSTLFREPPIALGAGGQLSSFELPWALWEHAEAPWATRPCVVVPQGDTNLKTILTAVRECSPGLRLHPSTEFANDLQVSVAGQPPSVGSLVWALGMCTGLGCRELATGAQEAEVFYTLRPGSHDEKAAWLLPSRGFISPLKTELGQALLEANDCERIVPLHASWRLEDLPAIYWWGLDMAEPPAGGSLLWVSYVNVGLVGPKGAYVLDSHDLPLM